MSVRRISLRRLARLLRLPVEAIGGMPCCMSQRGKSTPAIVRVDSGTSSEGTSFKELPRHQPQSRP